MNFNNMIQKLLDILSLIFIIVAIVAIIAGLIKSCSIEPSSTPVEEPIRIDSIKKDNKELIIKINNLDSIKDVETVKVQNLDNDSTLKLFYQLIRQ